MLTRKIRDAKDLSTDELIYFNSHAKTTYMSSGKNIEDTILEIDTKTNKRGVFKQIEYGTNNGTYTLKPNTYNKWDIVTDLTLLLEENVSSNINEYSFQFTSGIIPTVLSLPSNIIWANDDIPEIESGYIYQVNILNNLATYMQFKISVDALYSEVPLYFEALEPMTVSFSTNDIEYSFDNIKWTVLPTGTATPTIETRKKVLFRASGLTPNNADGIGTFSCTGKCNVGGNIMSIVYGDDFIGKIELQNDYQFTYLFGKQLNIKLVDASKLILPATALVPHCYQNMFSGCTSLTTAPELPATTLANGCYANMFSDCVSLTTAPELPATILASNCYQYMFYNCTSLSTAPELPATELAEYCYGNMFANCTSLTTVPSILPATTLASYCYSNMFVYCTSLTTVPSILPATTLASYCYSNMFAYCTSLTTAPELPATTLASRCYNYMFDGCTSLLTAPELPALTLASHCYYGMFINCSLLTKTPELPALTLASHCYYYMFDGCTSLLTASELPATTLADCCYQYMFRGCTNLTTAPELPATILAKYCYSSMFSGCYGLTTAPELPATTLAYACYEYMFSGCYGLTTAPELPATTLANYCYRYMFWGSSLTTAPELLPATTLATGCYDHMFYNCGKLTQAPMLPATTLVDYCYRNMFESCLKLNKIIMLATDVSASGCLSNWLYNVAPNGTFFKNMTITKYDLPTGTSGVPYTWTLYSYINKQIASVIPFYFENMSGALTISFNNVNNIEYSLDNINWTVLPAGTSTPIVNEDSYIFFRASGLVPNSSNGIGTFSCTGSNYNIGGNIMSMVYGGDFIGKNEINDYQFVNLFGMQSNLGLIDASNLILPATELANNCYLGMFSGCTSLTTAPELPATTLADNCYSNMFYGCTSLIEAPELPATTLAPYCYYYMFYNCSSLTTAPELPATTLADNCYYAMFCDCSNLNEITMLATNIKASSCLSGWVGGVASTGTFIKNANMTSLPSGTNGIPWEWTVIDY